MTTEFRSAGEILAWSRALFLPALQEAVASLPSSMRHIAGYHLGWWDADAHPSEASGGKAIRPAFTLLSAEAVGGRAEVAVPAAVAVELVHNFSLLHDDVIDRDETRRHRLTAWKVFGVGDAILAGDALLTLAFDVVSQGSPGSQGGRNPAAEQLLRTLCLTVQALIDGQHADVAFESRHDVALTECLAMAEHKTGALLSCACALGGLAAGGGVEQVGRLAAFGARLGLAFQVADDLQGIWGDPLTTGKPARSDLRNRKKSLPVVAALTSGTPAGQELAGWFARPGDPASAQDLERAAALVEMAGGRQWIESTLARLEAEVEGQLRATMSAGRAAADLAALARLVTATIPTATSGGDSGSGRPSGGGGGAKSMATTADETTNPVNGDE